MSLPPPISEDSSIDFPGQHGPDDEVKPAVGRRKWIVRWSVVAGIILAGLWFLIPPLHPEYWRKKAENEAFEHGVLLQLSLAEFESQFGCFPDASTSLAVKARTNTRLTLGAASSNQLLRQLLATEVMRSERPFYAKTAQSHRPDDDYSDDAHALSAGECGFAYVCRETSSRHPDTPVLLTPMIPGALRFDPKIYHGKAIVVCVHDMVRVLALDEAGHAIMNGMDLFDPRQPFWDGEVPEVKWPE